MNKEEFNKLNKIIKDKNIEIKYNPDKAIELLIDSGIYTKKGNLRKPYRKIG